MIVINRFRPSLTVFTKVDNIGGEMTVYEVDNSCDQMPKLNTKPY